MNSNDEQEYLTSTSYKQRIGRYICQCRKCNRNFSMYRAQHMNGVWAPGHIYEVCCYCAAEDAEKLYPEIRVRKRLH